MWIHRNAPARNGPMAAANTAVVPSPFNPNHRRYRTCCCHSKTFTLAFGVVELFVFCFVLVAIVPDFNTKICGSEEQLAESEQNDNEATLNPMNPILTAGRRRRQAPPSADENAKLPVQQNVPQVLSILAQKLAATTTTTVAPRTMESANASSAKENGSMRLLKNVTCSLSYVWLCWALVQMAFVLLMCYGVRRQRWMLLIPHIISRMFCAFVVWLVIVCLIGAFTNPASLNIAGHITLCTLLFATFLWIGLLLKAEIRCCEFVKRSAETGFSVSNTRPLGPPTLSQSDETREKERRAAAACAKMAKSLGPGAKKYQTPTNGRPVVAERIDNGQEMTMNTMVTGGSGTRPSTAGSGEKRSVELENGGHAETVFRGNDALSRAVAASRGAGLPPLRHTHRMVDKKA